MNPSTVRALTAALAVGQPVMLWGQPGTGKSATVAAVGKAMESRAWGTFPVEVVVASLREPVDFAGLPVVTDGNVRLAAPAWAQRLADAGQGLLFLDEITTAPPATQAALLRVVRERVVGDVELPADVVIVAAGNPADMNAGTWDMTSALANRFCHLDWQPDPAVFQAAIVAGFEQPEIPVFDGTVDEAQARRWVASFIAVRPQLLLHPPKDTGPEHRAWPSPRSWEAVARLLAAAETLKLDSGETRLLIEGVIGRATAVEFLSWLESDDLIDPEEVLEHPMEVDIPRRLDQLHAGCVAVVALAISEDTKKARTAAWKFLGRVADSGGTAVATVAARQLAEHHPPGEKLPPQMTLFLEVLRAAGLAG